VRGDSRGIRQLCRKQNEIEKQKNKLTKQKQQQQHKKQMQHKLQNQDDDLLSSECDEKEPMHFDDDSDDEVIDNKKPPNGSPMYSTVNKSNPFHEEQPQPQQAIAQLPDPIPVEPAAPRVYRDTHGKPISRFKYAVMHACLSSLRDAELQYDEEAEKDFISMINQFYVRASMATQSKGLEELCKPIEFKYMYLVPVSTRDKTSFKKCAFMKSRRAMFRLTYQYNSKVKRATTFPVCATIAAFAGRMHLLRNIQAVIARLVKDIINETMTDNPEVTFEDTRNAVIEQISEVVESPYWRIINWIRCVAKDAKIQVPEVFS
jgi:hypothetical protein